MSDGYDEKNICKLCKKGRTANGHDPCIANLPGVLFACCGHGEENGYIKFNDGRCLRFNPIEVDLDKPDTEVVVVDNVPQFMPGDKYKVFGFEKGRTKTKTIDHGDIVSIKGKAVTIKKIGE